MNYTIGKVAEMLEVSPQSLRIWERKALIPRSRRRPTGRREYTDEDVEAIRKFLDERNRK